MARASILALSLALAASACFQTSALVETDSLVETPGLEPIFDGRTLEGWEGDPRLWSVRDGVIHGETTPENQAVGNTFLIWQGGEIGDFDLRLSFRCHAPENNSGVQYRSRHVTDASAKNRWVVRGYQHEIRNESTFPDVSGFIYDEGGSRGRICPAGERATWEAEGGRRLLGTLIDQDEFTELMRIDDWNDVAIRAEGRRIRHWLNGRLILDFTDDDPAKALASGVIALQLHAGKPMWVEYRDIRLKKLP
jgi:hypothetical protein